MPHACTRQLDLFMNKALIDALEAPTPFNDAATGFDHCIHLSLFQAGEDDFNASFDATMPINIL
jgi:hypothetical protein